MKLSRLEIPQDIQDSILPIKDDDKAIQSYGIDFVVNMCTELFQSGEVGVVILHIPVQGGGCGHFPYSFDHIKERWLVGKKWKEM